MKKKSINSNVDKTFFYGEAIKNEAKTVFCDMHLNDQFFSYAELSGEDAVVEIKDVFLHVVEHRYIKRKL